MTATSKAREPGTAPLAPTDYFHYMPSAGDPRLFVMAEYDYPDPKEKFFDEYRAFKGMDGVPPRTLEPKYLPAKITLDKKRKIPPIFCTKGSWVVLDSAVRSAIESLEPGRHQFIPISAFHRNGEEEPRDFFVLNVHHVVNVMALEEMGAEARTNSTGDTVYMLPSSYAMKMKIKRAALDGAGHLFADPQCQFPSSAWFISKEMVAAIKVAKGRLCELYPCEVID